MNKKLKYENCTPERIVELSTTIAGRKINGYHVKAKGNKIFHCYLG